MQSRTVTDIEMYPYYPGITTEVAPIVVQGKGTLVTSSILGQQIYRLDLIDGILAEAVRVGAAFSWVGRDEAGARISSHWLYCTASGAKPAFGAICDWSRQGATFPLMSDAKAELIYLEELADISASLPTPSAPYAQSQARLGKKGWLVMTAMTMPGFMGMLIEDPTLPLSCAVGTSEISISATSARTLQTVGLSNLYCARIDTSALFLQGSA
ncbi:hypothetical protein [Thalassococcus lentus]|uniref:Hedgehog/Intein (Hint) domain-containing protein n=1 Tax=Thalassococcus lentus TaxID=1210524 RepID=A0ABT4XUR3_9RHOB|nr:hypothetical protein [Thalassococcus lentus]MDA7425637.1 hypothetical protein [Thalassococcus lentus]